MSKCQAKVEKTVPGTFWGTKKIVEECSNEAKGAGIFCQEHGCFDCSLKPVENCLEYEGIKLCFNCKAKREFEKRKEKEKWLKEEKERRRLAEEARKNAEEEERLRKEAEERERERENPDTPPPPPPNDPPKKPNPDQPEPNPEPTPFPQPSPNEPYDNSQQELNEIKQRIKTTHNLTEEEFNVTISPLTDKDLLEQVSLLLGKVKEAQNRKITDADSCLEFLISYRDASTDLIKKRAYEVANSYQQQVDQVISDLQSKKQVVDASLSELVKAKNEEELDLIYNEIQKNSELYQGEVGKIIDNHQQRTRDAIKIENKPQTTDLEKQLAAKLRIIINGDSDKDLLENLQKELNEFKSTPEVEKKTIYNNYGGSIDLMLQEIKDELTRREQSKKDQEKAPPSNKKSSSENKKTTIPLVIVIASISITLIAFSLYVVFQHRKKILKRSKNKKQ